MVYASNNIIRIMFLLGWLMLGARGFGDIIDVVNVAGEDILITLTGSGKGCITFDDAYSDYYRCFKEKSDQTIEFSLYGNSYRATPIESGIDKGKVIFEKYVQ